MTTVVRTKALNGSSGASLTITYDEGTALDSSHGHVAIIRSQAGSSIDPTPATPSGWTAIGTPVVATSGGFTVRLDFFRRLGDGTVNSITLAAATSVTRNGVLHGLDGITQAAFENATSFQSSTSNSSVATRSVTIPAAALSNTVNLVAVATSGVAGGTGFAWNDGTAAFGGTSSSSSMSSRYENVAASAANTYTATWTTAGLAVMGGLSFGGAAGGPTVARTDYDVVAVRDFRASASNAGGTMSHSISPTTNTYELSEGLFAIFLTNTTQSFTVTHTDSAGGTPPTTSFTVPAASSGGSGLEMLLKQGGVLTPL